MYDPVNRGLPANTGAPYRLTLGPLDQGPVVVDCISCKY